MQEVQWRTWSDAAFDESRESGKPVLLAISAVWCHWCHVMDQTTYSNSTVAGLINERFIPVRVDNDRNPDINDRYNMGGWPSTVFLTADRDVIAGATYVPPDQMVGVLQRVSSAYAAQRDEISAQARQARAEAEQRVRASAPGEAGPEVVESILSSVRSGYDREHGGFGFDQKFPFIDALALLLMNHEQTGTDRDLQMVTHTLDAMLNGQVFDSVEGGMFRYATRRDWTEPHYEKMLEDNARMAAVLLDAGRITGEQRYLDAALGIFRYAENTLRDSDTGLFRGSQDAAEKYYKAGAEQRARMEAPAVDTAAYVESNAAMAVAYLRRWAVTGDETARNHAIALVSLLNSLPAGADGTVRHYYEDKSARGYGILADQAGLLLANTECHEAAGDSSYLDRAMSLARSLDAFRSDAGGLHDISEQRARERRLDRYILPIDDNATVAIALARLYRLTSDASYLDRAWEVLNSLAGLYEDHGIMAARYGIALIAVLSHQPSVVS